MEFPEGWGGGEVQFKKTFHGRDMDIFWNNTLFQVENTAVSNSQELTFQGVHVAKHC